jgi:hypothetical protein
LARRARKETRRQTLNAAAAASGGSSGGALGAIRRLFGGGRGGEEGAAVNRAAAAAAAAIGAGGSAGGSGSGSEKSTIRKSIAAATQIEMTELGNGPAAASSSSSSALSSSETAAARVMASRGGAEQGVGEAEYQFVPSDWRRHLDEDGHTYFSHPKVINCPVLGAVTPCESILVPSVMHRDSVLCPLRLTDRPFLLTCFILSVLCSLHASSLVWNCHVRNAMGAYSSRPGSDHP